MNAKRLKVLILADSRSVHIERLVDEMVLQGCDVKVASLEKGTVNHITLKQKTPFKFLHYVLAKKQVMELLKEFQPDVINAHYATGYGFLAYSITKNYKKVSMILNLWGSDILQVPQKSFLHKYKAKKALSSANYVLGDSQYLIDKAKSIYDFCDYSVIPWGIEKKWLEVHKKDYTLSQPLKIIVPRPHEAVYNNYFIVESLKDLISSDKISLTFPGFGSQLETFKIKSQHLVGDKINFYEKKSREEYIKFLSRFDCYLSNSKSDSSPVSLIEVMALGLIPISADIEGVREWLTNENGFKYQVGDNQALEQIVEKIINIDDSFDSMRRSNFEKVKQSGIYEKNIHDHISVLKRVAGE